MADLIAIRVMPVNLTNNLAVPRPPPPPPPPPSDHIKRSASRNLFGAPNHGEIDALVEREQNLHCDHILQRYNINIKALDDHDRIMAAAVALQKQHKQQKQQQQQQQQHSRNVGDNQHHHHHHQLNKCNSIKNRNSNNNKQQISSSSSSSLKFGGTVSSLHAEPSTFLSLAVEQREQRSKPYARQRTIKDSFPVRKTLMQRRQETTPPNVPRCLAAASGSSINGANKSLAIKISSVTKNMTPPTSPALSSSSSSSLSSLSTLSSLSSSSSLKTLSNETDSKTAPTTTKNNKDNKSNSNNVVVVEVCQTSQSSSPLSSSTTTTTITTTETPLPMAKCNETS